MDKELRGESREARHFRERKERVQRPWDVAFACMREAEKP